MISGIMFHDVDGEPLKKAVRYCRSLHARKMDMRLLVQWIVNRWGIKKIFVTYFFRMKSQNKKEEDV